MFEHNYNTYNENHRHIYLYAKGWYKKTDTIDDLKVIIGDMCALLPEHVDIGGIKSILIGIVYEIFQRENLYKSKLEAFILDCESSVIGACLSVIRMARARSPHINIDFGEPDYNLLPKSLK